MFECSSTGAKYITVLKGKNIIFRHVAYPDQDGDIGMCEALEYLPGGSSGYPTKTDSDDSTKTDSDDSTKTDSDESVDSDSDDSTTQKEIGNVYVNCECGRNFDECVCPGFAKIVRDCITILNVVDKYVAGLYVLDMSEQFLENF